MINSELKKYIKESKQQGLSDDRILDELLKVGWDKNDVMAVLKSKGNTHPKRWRVYSIIGVPIFIFVIAGFILSGVLLDAFVESTIGGDLTSCPGIMCIIPIPTFLGWFVWIIFFLPMSLLYADFILSLRKKRFLRASIFPTISVLIVSYFIMALAGPMPQRCALLFDNHGRNRSECYYSAIGPFADSAPSLDACKKIGDSAYRYSCISKIAAKNRDVSSCDLIPAGFVELHYPNLNLDKKGECIIEVARLTGEKTICDTLSESDVRDFCLIKLSASTVTNNPETLCESMDKGASQDACYINVVYNSHNVSLCKRISDSSEYKRCISSAVFEDDFLRVLLPSEYTYQKEQGSDCYSEVNIFMKNNVSGVFIGKIFICQKDEKYSGGLYLNDASPSYKLQGEKKTLGGKVYEISETLDGMVRRYETFQSDYVIRVIHNNKYSGSKINSLAREIFEKLISNIQVKNFPLDTDKVLNSEEGLKKAVNSISTLNWKTLNSGNYLLKYPENFSNLFSSDGVILYDPSIGTGNLYNSYINCPNQQQASPGASYSQMILIDGINYCLTIIKNSPDSLKYNSYEFIKKIGSDYIQVQIIATYPSLKVKETIEPQVIEWAKKIAATLTLTTTTP